MDLSTQLHRSSAHRFERQAVCLCDIQCDDSGHLTIKNRKDSPTDERISVLDDIKPFPIWQGILARVCEGREMTFAVAELDPGAIAARHQHQNEQVGLVIQGAINFEIGGERRLLKAGDTYTIQSNVPHEAVAGPQGCVLIDVFAPVRADWRNHKPQSPKQPRWPSLR